MNSHPSIRHHVHLVSPLQNISNYTETIKDKMEIGERKLELFPHTLTDALLTGSMKLASDTFSIKNIFLLLFEIQSGNTFHHEHVKHEIPML